jgi:hypothetical protein
MPRELKPIVMFEDNREVGQKSPVAMVIETLDPIFQVAEVDLAPTETTPETPDPDAPVVDPAGTPIDPDTPVVDPAATGEIETPTPITASDKAPAKP